MLDDLDQLLREGGIRHVHGVGKAWMMRRKNRQPPFEEQTWKFARETKQATKETAHQITKESLTGVVYAACYNGGVISISGSTVTNLTTSSQCPYPSGVSVNSVTGVVYAACSGGAIYSGFPGSHFFILLYLFHYFTSLCSFFLSVIVKISKAISLKLVELFLTLNFSIFTIYLFLSIYLFIFISIFPNQRRVKHHINSFQEQLCNRKWKRIVLFCTY